jgi:hypothetical protein
MIAELKELTFFQRLLWRLHFYFGYLAVKRTFGKAVAKHWYKQSLATLDKVPERWSIR